MNHFEIFGLPRKLGIDAVDLQRRFHELSRRHHPDVHHSAPADEQARVLEVSARVNTAYRTLRDPIARVEYLVRLEEGRETKESIDDQNQLTAMGRQGSGPSRSQASTAKPSAPPELLAEMFEIQEALQEARMGGLDVGARAALAEQRERLVERAEAEEVRLTGALSQAWDATGAEERPALLAAFKEALARRAYLRTVIDDLAEALGASGEGPEAGRGPDVAGRGSDVAHRRH